MGSLLLAILFLLGTARPASAQVGDQQKISDAAGNFGGTLEDKDEFGGAMANIGDLDDDGNDEFAVGAPNDDDGGSGSGAIWIVFPDDDGTVSDQQKISDTAGGFSGTLNDGDDFGRAIAGIGDLDGDGIPDLAVGAPFTDDGGGSTSTRGAVWILFLNANGTVSGSQKISDTAGGFSGTLQDEDSFGLSVATVGTLNNDDVPDLAVGIPSSDERRGGVWVLFLNQDGTVSGSAEIDDSNGGFDGFLGLGDEFGHSVAGVGDLTGDQIPDLAVGAPFDTDDNGDTEGSFWLLEMNADGTVANEQKITEGVGGFSQRLDDGDSFAVSLTSLGDLNGNGAPELAVGTPTDDDGGTFRGAVWVVYLRGGKITVLNQQKISDTEGGFTGSLSDGDQFGRSVASVGDLDSNGVLDFAVGASGNGVPGNNYRLSAAWVLFGTQSLLPVEFVSFEGRRAGNETVALRWKTASETNNAGFRVQRRRSNDGDWKTIGQKQGAGTTSQPQSYRFTDTGFSFETDALFYRLKQIDADGTAHFSKTITVERDVDEVQLLGTSPNPARQRATVRYALPQKQEIAVRLYDVLGREVRTVVNGRQEGRHRQAIDVSGLPSGMYVLRLEATGQVDTQKMMIVQ